LVRELSAEIIAPPATPAARQDQLLATLARLRDPQARFMWAVERARQRPQLPEQLRVDTHRVTGCQVRLWLVAEFAGGRCRFRTDSDAVTLKAMTGLLCDLCSDGTPAEIVALDFAFLDQLGLLRQLAENRRVTVLRVAEQIRAFAAARV
jgi:cysteine desulfuration protein SufE